ncbi:hypothetical protein [Nocardia lasii]|uniref:ATP-binding protein n=1 Tax=Nocardia lasii TaxID=1616107 RepID=A0ABW1JQX6_9NOCA
MRIVCLNCITDFELKESGPGWVSTIRHSGGGYDKRVRTFADRLSARCPNGCELDAELLARPTKVVSFIGESASSKSHLIVSMIYSMMNDPLLNRDCSMTISQRSVALWDRLRYRLVDTRRALDATAPRRVVHAGSENRHEPRGARFRPRQNGGDEDGNSPGGTGLEPRVPLLVKVTSLYTGASVNLAFIDVAGEDIADAEVAAKVSPHLAITDFLWCVVPSTLNKRYLAQMRAGAGEVDQASLDNAVEHSQTVERTILMIDQVAALWREANGFPRNVPIARDGFHAATIVAKSDLLSLLQFPDIGSVAPPSTWATDDGADSGNLYNLGQIARRGWATREVVRSLFPAVDAKMATEFSDNRYFPVSAVGCSKQSDDSFPVFKPFGVVDPAVLMLNSIHELHVPR